MRCTILVKLYSLKALENQSLPSVNYLFSISLAAVLQKLFREIVVFQAGEMRGIASADSR